MRIPGNIGPVSLVPVCAMRVINGLPPANLICFIINPTKAVWAGLAVGVHASTGGVVR